MDICLSTPRLTLRPLCYADAESHFALWKDPQVHCYIPEKLKSLAQARRQIEEKMSCEDDSVHLAVFLKETGAFLGEVFGGFRRDNFGLCFHFLPQFCGKGYGYEAACAYLDFLFSQCKVRRVYAYVEETNLPSRRLCRKLGMRREALFLEYISFVNAPDGAPLYENTMVFALLKKEWQAGGALPQTPGPGGPLL